MSDLLPADEREPVEGLTLNDLREEYQDLTETIYSTHVEHALRDRAARIWTELRSRTDVEQPQCPECGGRSWSQSPGDPIRCKECGKEGVLDDDLREEIQIAWQKIIHGAGGDGQ